MLVWLTLPFYDFCGFRSIAVNSVYKMQFFTFTFAVLLPVLSRLLIISKFKFSNGRNSQDDRTRSLCQISLKSLKPRLRYGYCSIFEDGGRPPSKIFKSSEYRKSPGLNLTPGLR